LASCANDISHYDWLYCTTDSTAAVNEGRLVHGRLTLASNLTFQP